MLVVKWGSTTVGTCRTLKKRVVFMVRVRKTKLKSLERASLPNGQDMRKVFILLSLKVKYRFRILWLGKDTERKGE